MFGPTAGKSKCSAATVDVWSHSGKVEMFLGVVRNVVFLLFVGNQGTFSVQNRILLATGTEPFKTHKSKTLIGTAGTNVISKCTNCPRCIFPPVSD